MRKKVKDVVKQTVRQSLLEYFWVTIRGMGFGALIVFLGYNIIASQNIHPLYFQVINDNRQAEAVFLKAIRLLPDYNYFYQIARQKYGEIVDQEMNREAERKKATIANLESILERNPKARDVLFNLGQLYESEGDIEKATLYRERAIAVDPMVGK